MGDSTGSMFYAFAAFLVIYFIGAAVYCGHKFISTADTSSSAASCAKSRTKSKKGDALND